MQKQKFAKVKSILRKYGVRDYETAVTKTLKMNFDKFVNIVESLYVIDRISSCYEDEKKQQACTQANKEWLKVVIEDNLCHPLEAYLQQYGSDIVYRAICYLIDNGLWDTYKGKDYLEHRVDGHWKGLEMIESAAEYVKDEISETDEAEEKTTVEFVEEEEETTDTLSADVEKHVRASLSEEDKGHFDAGSDEHCKEFASEVYDNVIAAQNKLKEAVVSLNGFANYVIATSDHARAAHMIDGLVKYSKKQESQITPLQEECGKLTMENAELRNMYDSLKELHVNDSKEISDLTRKYSARGEEIKRLQEMVVTRNDEIQEKVKKYHELENDLAMCEKELSELKESQTAIPKAKIIKASELRKLPLVGDKMIDILTEALGKHNIVIDPNR